MTDRIAQIKARLDAATPGPWEVMAQDSGHSQYEMCVWIVDQSTGDSICDMDGLMRSRNEKFDDDGYDDAVFIANAPEDIAHLLAKLAEATNQRDQARTHRRAAWDAGYTAAILDIGNEFEPSSTNPWLPGQDGTP